MPKTTNFVSIILCLRGVAALMVFLFHLFCLSNNYYSNEVLTSIFRYGKYGVEIFFMILGFVITLSLLNANYKLKNYFSFFKKRIIRIEPPYLFALSLFIIYAFIREYQPSFNGVSTILNLTQVTLHLGYLIPFSDYGWISIVFWTLAIEFQFYIVFALIFPLLLKNNIYRIGTLLFILILTYINPLGEESFFHFSPLFFMCILLALQIHKSIHTKPFLVLSGIGFIIIFSSFNMAISIIASLTYLIIYFFPNKNFKLLNFFGKISYSLYLMHTLTAFFIINIAHKFPQTIELKILFTLLALGLTIGFSYLTYVFLEKPTIAYSKKITYKKNA